MLSSANSLIWTVCTVSSTSKLLSSVFSYETLFLWVLVLSIHLEGFLPWVSQFWRPSHWLMELDGPSRVEHKVLIQKVSAEIMSWFLQIIPSSEPVSCEPLWTHTPLCAGTAFCLLEGDVRQISHQDNDSVCFSGLFSGRQVLPDNILYLPGTKWHKVGN